MITKSHTPYGLPATPVTEGDLTHALREAGIEELGGITPQYESSRLSRQALSLPFPSDPTRMRGWAIRQHKRLGRPRPSGVTLAEWAQATR